MKLERVMGSCLLLFWLNACTGEQYSATEIMVTKDGYAMQGYDPVAYFTDGAPSKGKSEFSTEWRGGLPPTSCRSCEYKAHSCPTIHHLWHVLLSPRITTSK